jgi:hypothetical protein
MVLVGMSRVTTVVWLLYYPYFYSFWPYILGIPADATRFLW